MLRSTLPTTQPALQRPRVEQTIPTPAPHPVSLPALFAKDIVGSDFVVGDVLDANDAYTRYFITYKSGQLNISGIMNVPTGTGSFPLLILNHGYIDPAVYTNGRGLRREQDYLARRGYVVLHPDYRNHAQSDDDPENEYTFRLGYTEDVIAAVKAIRAANLPYLDASRVGMLGHSMGGGVAMNTLVVDPELVRAAVLFAPVSTNYVRNYERWTKSNSDAGKEIISRYGSPDAAPEFWANVSAKNFFSRIKAPILIHHGSADADVELMWSDELAVWLSDAGKEHTYHVYPGEPHEFSAAWPVVMQRTVDFFDVYLKQE